MQPGLFAQLVVQPLFSEHRILTQVAGHKLAVLKVLPPLVLGDTDVAAAGRVAKGRPLTREAFERSLFEAIHAPSGTRDVDLLIRTGGEQRLSDFLLWESAYAELYFTDVAWPDFSEADLASAIEAFAARERRYGGVQSTAR